MTTKPAQKRDLEAQVERLPPLDDNTLTRWRQALVESDQTGEPIVFDWPLAVMRLVNDLQAARAGMKAEQRDIVQELLDAVLADTARRSLRLLAAMRDANALIAPAGYCFEDPGGIDQWIKDVEDRDGLDRAELPLGVIVPIDKVVRFTCDGCGATWTGVPAVGNACAFCGGGKVRATGFVG